MPNFKGQVPERILPGGSNPEQEQQGQKVQQQARKYETVLKNFMHSPQTRDETVEMLKASGDPLVSIPNAAININDMASMAMKKNGLEVTPAVMLAASEFLLSDLALLGEASGAFPPVSDEEMEAIAEDTYQMFIERGLKDKSIDPIQLQSEAEQMMPDDMAAFGVVYGAGNVPPRPSREALVALDREGAVNKALQQERSTVAQKGAQEKQRALIEQALRSRK